MAPRVNSELLLVGSLPADSTEAALRAGAGVLRRPRLRAAGRRDGPAGGVGRLRARAAGAAEPGRRSWSGDRVADRHPAPRVRDADLRVRDGVPSCTGTRGRASTTRSSRTGVPRAARRRASIPADVRFQIGLPFPSSALNAFKADFAADYPIAERAFEDLVRPRARAADRGDPARRARDPVGRRYEVQDIEGVLAWSGGRGVGALRRPGRPADAADPGGGARRLPPLLRHVPGVADVRGARHGAAGAHGEPRGRAVRAARSTGCTWPARATCAARTSASSGRWPISTSGDTRVFLGIVLPLDGIPGLRRRHATASKYLDDFGVAMYCGFGRQPGADGSETMREHPRGPPSPSATGR